MKKISVLLPLLIMSFIFFTAGLGLTQQPICIITVDPKVLFINPEGGREEVRVTASAPGCAFAPRTADSWIRTYSSEENDRRTVVIEAGPTSNLQQRVGSVMVGTTQIEVVQKPADHLNW